MLQLVIASLIIRQHAIVVNGKSKVKWRESEHDSITLDRTNIKIEVDDVNEKYIDPNQGGNGWKQDGKWGKTGVGFVINTMELGSNDIQADIGECTHQKTERENRKLDEEEELREMSILLESMRLATKSTTKIFGQRLENRGEKQDEDRKEKNQMGIIRDTEEFETKDTEFSKGDTNDQKLRKRAKGGLFRLKSNRAHKDKNENKEEHAKKVRNCGCFGRQAIPGGTHGSGVGGKVESPVKKQFSLKPGGETNSRNPRNQEAGKPAGSFLAKRKPCPTHGGNSGCSCTKSKQTCKVILGIVCCFYLVDCCCDDSVDDDDYYGGGSGDNTNHGQYTAATVAINAVNLK